jgi:hypothetical protein
MMIWKNLSPKSGVQLFEDKQSKWRYDNFEYWESSQVSSYVLEEAETQGVDSPMRVNL